MMEQAKIKVLICDDSMLVRKKLRVLLEDDFLCVVTEAANGCEAVNQYQAENPQLVFMDIVMPVKGGIEAVTEIIQFDNNAKVVMASSSGTKTHLKKALEAGAYEFIQKPFEETQIKKILSAFKGGV